MSVFRRFREALPHPRMLRLIFCLAAGLVWAITMLSLIFNTEPRDDAAHCRRSVFRDPVTGRDQGIGGVHIAGNGAVTCRGVTYSANP